MVNFRVCCVSLLMLLVSSVIGHQGSHSHTSSATKAQSEVNCRRQCDFYGDCGRCQTPLDDLKSEGFVPGSSPDTAFHSPPTEYDYNKVGKLQQPYHENRQKVLTNLNKVTSVPIHQRAKLLEPRRFQRLPFRKAYSLQQKYYY